MQQLEQALKAPFTHRGLAFSHPLCYSIHFNNVSRNRFSRDFKARAPANRAVTEGSPATTIIAVTAEARPPPASPAQFDWYKQWYPVAVLDDLNPAMPCAARLLGIDLVVWWDSAGAMWR